MESPMVGLVVLAVAYPAVFVLFLIGLCRAAAASRRVDEEAADPVHAAAEQMVDDLEAMLNATACDCTRCKARRPEPTP